MMKQKKSRIKCPSLGLTLAAHALREALEEQRVILPVTLEELQGLCARERRPRILAGYLRWQREEISRLLARCIVENADTMEAEFLHRHYREGRSIHYLSLHLPASERYLYAMHERILGHLSALLFYRVSSADAYAPALLQNLLSILDMRIGTFVLRAELPVAEGWLESLYDARARCRALLDLIDTFMRRDTEQTEYERIICAKIQHPFAAPGELPELAGADSIAASTVHAYLHRYIDEVRGITGEILPVKKSSA